MSDGEGRVQRCAGADGGERRRARRGALSTGAPPATPRREVPTEQFPLLANKKVPTLPPGKFLMVHTIALFSGTYCADPWHSIYKRVGRRKGRGGDLTIWREARAARAWLSKAALLQQQQRAGRRARLAAAALRHDRVGRQRQDDLHVGRGGAGGGRGACWVDAGAEEGWSYGLGDRGTGAPPPRRKPPRAPAPAAAHRSLNCERALTT